MADRQASSRFFVQDRPKEAWHVESEDNCEVMLCSKQISVDSYTARIRTSWPSRKCPDCWIVLEQERLVSRMGRR